MSTLNTLLEDTIADETRDSDKSGVDTLCMSVTFVVSLFDGYTVSSVSFGTSISCISSDFEELIFEGEVRSEPPESGKFLPEFDSESNRFESF